MEELRIELGERSYNIIIRRGVLGEVGPLVRQVGLLGKVMLVSNPEIYALYGATVRDGLSLAGYQVIYAEVPDGEEYKTMSQAMKLVDLAVDNRLDRQSWVITLGGGVIGDLGGLVAAIYQRGINYVQVPTTLLSQVDSSVGGKVAVNHPRAKNMIGAFHQPRLVIIDPNVLQTLPQREYLSGLAEVVKYGIIQDPEFFSFLEDNFDLVNRRDPEVIHYLITRSCAIKAEVVRLDEREEGLRAILNLGHTFGHALETRAGYGQLRHGEGVALGMIIASTLAWRLGILAPESYQRIRNLIQNLGLAFEMPGYATSELVDIMYQDKKMQGGHLRLVLPTAIGKVVIKDDLDRKLIEGVLDCCKT